MARYRLLPMKHCAQQSQNDIEKKIKEVRSWNGYIKLIYNNNVIVMSYVSYGSYFRPSVSYIVLLYPPFIWHTVISSHITITCMYKIV